MELKVTRYEIAADGVATLWLHRPGPRRPGSVCPRNTASHGFFLDWD